MKIKNLLLALPIFILSLTSCMEREGCQNVLAQNFDQKADIECCCEFNVESLITQIKGVRNYQEDCSPGSTYNKDIEISEVAGNSNEIRISGLGLLEEHEVIAVFKDGFFEFNQLNDFLGCNYRITGKLIPVDQEITIETNTTGVAECNSEFNNACVYKSI